MESLRSKELKIKMRETEGTSVCDAVFDEDAEGDKETHNEFVRGSGSNRCIIEAVCDEVNLT